MYTVASARADLLSRADLDARGLSSRAIEAAIANSVLRRVHHGWYVEAKVWDAAYAEKRHLLRVVAAHAQQRSSDVHSSHTSAVVLHGLPLFRLTPRRVHVSGAALGGHVSKPDVARHRVDVPDADQTVIDGIACTSLARTVADMVRLAPPEAGLSIADAALRFAAWDDAERAYDEGAAENLRSQIRSRMERNARARGIRRGRHVLDLADGRAQLPGESVSRLYLVQLGFAVPRLQVPIPAPDGGRYFVDFGLDDVNAWGEYDGEAKYLDPALRGPATLEQTLLDEKIREDWIRGTTNRRYPRWGKAAIVSAASLGARLAKFHVVPPG
jgi:hypothetical protein